MTHSTDDLEDSGHVVGECSTMAAGLPLKVRSLCTVCSFDNNYMFCVVLCF